MMPSAAVWESTVGAFGAPAFRPPTCLVVWPGTTATAPASGGGSVETGMFCACLWRERVERRAERDRDGAALSSPFAVVETKRVIGIDVGKKSLSIST